MFCDVVVSVGAMGGGRERAGVNAPQPNMGVPGAAGFILTFLGDAGVVGRADMVTTVDRKNSCM